MAKRLAKISNECVACGSCLKVCPMNAITIFKGVIARVDKSLCVGCGKCFKECPAGVIEIVNREVKDEK